jgi:hypothetical protein
LRWSARQASQPTSQFTRAIDTARYRYSGVSRRVSQ